MATWDDLISRIADDLNRADLNTQIGVAVNRAITHYQSERTWFNETTDTFTTTQLSGEKAGEVRILKFDRTTRTWNYSDSQVCDQPVMTFLDDQAEAVRVYTENGPKDLSASDLANTETLRSKLMACGNEGLACAN